MWRLPSWLALMALTMPLHCVVVAASEFEQTGQSGGILCSVSTPLSDIVVDRPTLLNLERESLQDLEQRRDRVDLQLQALSRPSMRTGVAAIGFRSDAHTTSEHPEWIQIELGEARKIDQVVLVPSIWRDGKTGFRADGFPLEFRVLVGNDEDTNGRVVAHYGTSASLLPRVSPVVIEFPGTTASWVRVEALKLSPRAWDGMYILQLSEVLVFSGLENVALRQRVKASSDDARQGSPRDKRFLVDGFVPYLMDTSEGAHSVAFLGTSRVSTDPTIIIDLESVQPIDGIHLHATDLSDSVPQAVPENFGIPRRMLIEGATQEDFSDGTTLLEYRYESDLDSGPIIMLRFPETACRYVRFTVLEPYLQIVGNFNRSRIGFAEIEVLVQGANVAVDKPVDVNFRALAPNRSIDRLTDGSNLFGPILPIREWLSELALRHELESQRPRIAAELHSRYQQQQANFRWLVLITVLVVAGATCSVLVQWAFRRRAIFQTRERIGADLHDELGANLHAISLLGDLAQANLNSPKKLAGLLKRMRALTERTGDAARYFVNLHESKSPYGDLIEDMLRTSARMMADLEHEITFEGKETIRLLSAQQRLDLFLFYKECLVNILRHSGATRVQTRLVAEPSKVVLTIIDNGRGLTHSIGDRVPSSISRRARLLGARVTAEDRNEGGTCIALQLQTRRFGISL